MKAAAIVLALLGTVAVIPGTDAAPGGSAPPPPRRLLVQVRDTPPEGPASIRHGSDGAYSVSTGSGADRDDRGALAPDNATTVSTSNHVRRLHLVAGERVRVDLPAVQSLQFHLGAAAAPGGGKGGGNTAAAAPGSAGTGSAAAGGPAASGVVYFEAVTAFAARFLVAGPTVRIELAPLHRGEVAAPYAASGSPAARSVTLTGRLGQWIALGDTDLGAPGKSLNATAEPTTPAAVWVRVDPDTSGAEQ
jgi:hypothetical protein